MSPVYAGDPDGEEAGVRVPVPNPDQRWRCGGCGNLTRFDVTLTRRTTEFWHFDLAGDHVVEEPRTLTETAERVRCRWCGRDDAIEVVDRAQAHDDDLSQAGP